MTIIFLILFLLIFSSCGNNTDVEKSFANKIDLIAEHIAIDELLNINNLVKTEDYIVLQNTTNSGQDIYYVYSCPELDFLYSFGANGRGPEEYLMPSVIKNTKGNNIGFRDHATDIVAFYELSDTEAVLKSSREFSSPDYDRFFWEINMMDDSLFLIKHQGYQRGLRELWNIESNRMVYSIANSFPKLPRKLGKNYYTIFDDYLIASNGVRFVTAYCFIDRIEFGKVEKNTIRLTSSVGAMHPPEFHLYGHDTETEYSIDRNIVCYENVYAGTDYVYALYSGRRLDETENNHSSVIEIYTWDGKPDRVLYLDSSVAYFAVDEKDGIIYAVNPDEDSILKFRLP